MTISEIKSQAKAVVLEQWKDAYLIPSILTIIVGFLANVFVGIPLINLLFLFVSLYISIWLIKVSLFLYEGKDAKSSEVKTTGSELLSIFCASFLLGLIVFIPVFLLSFTIVFTAYEEVSSFIPVLLFILIMAFVIFISARFSMYQYILLENPNIGIWNSLKESFRLMRGHEWHYILFELSFILWYILMGMTLGIAGLFVLPYISYSEIIFYNDIKPIAESVCLEEEETAETE